MKKIRLILKTVIVTAFLLNSTTLKSQDFYYAISVGDTVELSVYGENGTVQWQEAEQETGPFTNITGATTNVHTLYSLSSGSGFKFYRAEITNTSVCAIPWYSPIIKHRIINSTIDVQVGDWFAGGLVFFIDGAGSGLLAAMDDASMGAAWGCYNTNIAGTNSNMGMGSANTTAILAGCSTANIAADLCESFTSNGYNDWFLPSFDELNEMYILLYQNNLGNFQNTQYWSSTQFDSGTGRYFRFQDGGNNNANKNNLYNVRAARAFAPPPTVQMRLDAGEHPKQIYDSGMPLDSLYGRIYQGGQIFYLDIANGSGFVATEQDYAESAWGCHGTAIAGANGTVLGTGAANTQAIVASCAEANIAAKIANDLTTNGYTDWFLPSADALVLMYDNLKENGYGMTVNYYWSSTQLSATNAVRIYSQGSNGDPLSNTKSMSHYVKGVRAFEPPPPPPPVTDIDGNSYNTVQIGTQIWMAENLKVTHYPNGDAIPIVTDNTSWANLTDDNTSDAYCYYNNNASGEADIYGALYTYAAAIGDNWLKDNADDQGVCPDGWRLPTNADLDALSTYLGANAGSKMAGNAALWTDGVMDQSVDFGTSGFSVLPGGVRNNDSGEFLTIGAVGYCRSASESSSSYANYRYVQYYNTDIHSVNHSKSSGYPVRCVKN